MVVPSRSGGLAHGGGTPKWGWRGTAAARAPMLRSHVEPSEASRPAHGGDAPDVGGGDGESGLCAAAAHGAGPTAALSEPAQPGPAGFPDAAPAQTNTVRR